MKLYFQNSNGKEIFISDVNNEEEACRHIKKFCNDRDFAIPYMRMWGSLYEDGITYDVSSHSEFFKLKRD